MTDPAGLVDAVRARRPRRARPGCLSIVEAGGDAARAAMAALPVTAADAAWTVGVTGAPGAGKSTLTAALVRHLRLAGARIGVLAVDPSSPFTGGAILGDRVRMQRSHHRPRRVHPLDGHTRSPRRPGPRRRRRRSACSPPPGTTWIVVETVGVGQVEVAIAGTADTTVVVVNPGWGDGVQAAKAGLLEIGDVFVVNKADRDGVAATVHDLQGDARCSAEHREWRPPVLETVATDDRGIDDARRRDQRAIGPPSRRRATSRTRREQRISGRNSCIGA